VYALTHRGAGPVVSAGRYVRNRLADIEGFREGRRGGGVTVPSGLALCCFRLVPLTAGCTIGLAHKEPTATGWRVVGAP